MEKRIPDFTSIEEAYSTKTHHNHGIVEWTLIVPAETGQPSRYHVLRVFATTGQIKMIGNELDITTARAVARRPSERDDEPLTDEEWKEARSSYPSRNDTWWPMTHRRKSKKTKKRSSYTTQNEVSCSSLSS